ncbi:hypothetical protein C0993_012623, partial [Termitomyces sp. T159_Od127]
MQWELKSVLVGFTWLCNAHNGERLGQAPYKLVNRIGIAHKIGHITCDNTSNNSTMLQEFARHLKDALGKEFPWKKRKIKQ